MTERLSLAFRTHLAPALHSALPADLENVLAELVSRARAAWPDLAVPEEELLGHLAERLAEPVAEGLAKVHAADLYFACGCLRRAPSALAGFEREYVPVLRAAVHRAGFSAGVTEEVEQILRERLLVGDGAHAPKLAQYTGRGDLRSWLRVVAVREALLLLRKHGREVPVEDAELVGRVVATPDPELEFLKQRYRGDFDAAFREAIAAATADERNLLRYHFLEGLTLDQLARMHGVHRATVTRWITRAKERLLELVRATLRQNLKASESEIDSLIRLARSELRITLRGFL